MIIPVILSGGSSSPHAPVSESVMITQTAKRVANKAFFSAPIVIGNKTNTTILNTALADYLPACTVLEPFGRHTAAAIAIAALLAYEIEPDTPMLILPSDHVIRNNDAFLQAVHLTTPMVDAGYIVTFGIKPTGPNINYGYIEKGAEIAEHEFAKRIRSFVEKPSEEKAQTMLETGQFYWNSGIVMATAETLLDEFNRFAPHVLSACRDTLAHSPEIENIIDLSPEYFEKVPRIAFDVAVLEKTQKAVVLQAAFDWSDVGSITHASDATGQIAGQKFLPGNVVVRNETDLSVQVTGVSDIIVTVTADGIIISPNTK